MILILFLGCWFSVGATELLVTAEYSSNFFTVEAILQPPKIEIHLSSGGPNMFLASFSKITPDFYNLPKIPFYVYLDRFASL